MANSGVPPVAKKSSGPSTAELETEAAGMAKKAGVPINLKKKKPSGPPFQAAIGRQLGF